MKPVSKISRAFRALAILPILFYRHFISPMLRPSCIYTPSCSLYAMQAIKKHGVLKGIILGSVRISRCHGSFFTGGDDPVPENFSWNDIRHSYKKFK